MRKSLLAVAVLGAFAGTAMAADVTLYGRIDTGLAYTHQDLDQGKSGKTDTFEMTSGFSTGSRWGIKGTEDLGNGYSVGFVLESGFSSDNGTTGQSSKKWNDSKNVTSRLFGREALISVSGGFGTVYAGRMASILSDAGSLGMEGPMTAFGNTRGIVGTTKGSTGAAFGRHDNALAYATPKFGGFDAKIMYSFRSDDGVEDTKENSGDTTRYAALGMRYAQGPLTAVFLADYTIYGNTQYGSDQKDGYNVMLGGNYDFGAATLFVKANYFDKMIGTLDSFSLGHGKKSLEGWGAEVGTKIPLAGGNVLAAVGFRGAKQTEAKDHKYERWNVAVGYDYPFSKRTNVYVATGYAQEKDKAADKTPKAYQLGFGLVHKF
jgi:predicted porin